MFAATETFTVPLPLPAAPDVIEIQLAFVVAVHEQEAEDVTVNELRVLPDEGSDNVVGFTLNEQGGGVGAVDAAC